MSAIISTNCNSFLFFVIVAPSYVRLPVRGDESSAAR
jgi:hypothetical protein